MRSLLFFLIFAALLNAQPPAHDMTVGDWRTVTKATSENRTNVTEKEFLNLKSDHTFEITILVSLKKGEHFIKDLQVKASGIWKRHITTLVIVIEKIEVPFAKEVSRTITRRSLEALANTYQSRLKGNPIRLYTITFLNNKTLTIVSEQGVKTSYTKFTKASAPKQKAPKKPAHSQ